MVSQGNELDLICTPAEVAQLFDEVMTKLLARANGASGCVVPLSGGWDSRILLGAALEHFPRSAIRTFSYGTPGQLDYEIGRKIAESVGVAHEAIDLSQWQLDWDELLMSVRTAPWTYSPDVLFNRACITRICDPENDILLSGFLGDVITGGHLYDFSSEDELYRYFFKKQQREKSVWLAEPSYDPQAEASDFAGLGTGEVLDIAFRQLNCVLPIVTGQKGIVEPIGAVDGRASGLPLFLMPFSNQRWIRYWLAVPNRYKLKQSLYLQFLKHKYPALAELPSKNRLGHSSQDWLGYQCARIRVKARTELNKLWPSVVQPYLGNLNYVDHAGFFRTRDDYQTVLSRAVKYLKDHDVTPWLDIQKLVDEHMSRKVNRQHALWLLIGLALNLAVEAERVKQRGVRE